MTVEPVKDIAVLYVSHVAFKRDVQIVPVLKTTFKKTQTSVITNYSV
jgi:hypothetical protein